MPFLTVAGVTVVVQDSSASEGPPTLIGGSARAFDGTLRSSVRASKRNWQFTTNPMTDANVATLRAAIETGTQIVTCSGDALLGASVSCEVQITDIQYIRDPRVATDFSRTLTLQLAEA